MPPSADAFRTLAIKRMPQLGDLQLLVGDQRLVGSRTRPACGNDRLQRVDIVRQRFGIRPHSTIESQLLRCRPHKCVVGDYPAQLGRNVWRGLRQSIPSST